MCACIIGASRIAIVLPSRSFLAYRVPTPMHSLAYHLARFLVFEAALIYRAESASTPENILPRRGVVCSDDEWRNRRGRARQRGTGARGSAGKSAEADETTFFFPPAPPSAVSLCDVYVPFSCVLDPALLLKIGNRVLRVRTADKTPAIRVWRNRHRRMKKIGATNHPWKWAWRRIGWIW